MTIPNTDPGATTSGPKAESFVDWFHVNARWVTVGALAVVIAGAVAWYIPTQRTTRNVNADKALLSAKQSLASGNAQLAESDLKKVADRFAGAPAGTEAGILLAQIRYDKGEYQPAIADLQKLADKLGSDPAGASVQALIGDGYAQQNKPAEAAAAYEKAAGLTSMPNEQALYLVKAGHSYTDAGKQAEARKIWEGLAAHEENAAVAAEARVRLGELMAAAPKS
jgi:predicted negative regulator of RcsB-dependent stress response